MTTRTTTSAVTALAILMLLTGVAGYGVGLHVGAGPRMSEVRVFRAVPAQIGDGVVTALVADGTSYGFHGDVPWVDAAGGWHEGDWPACLPRLARAPITFGGAVIVGPTGVGDARILWVDCRAPS